MKKMAMQGLEPVIFAMNFQHVPCHATEAFNSNVHACRMNIISMHGDNCSLQDQSIPIQNGLYNSNKNTVIYISNKL